MMTSFNANLPHHSKFFEASERAKSPVGNCAERMGLGGPIPTKLNILRNAPESTLRLLTAASFAKAQQSTDTASHASSDHGEYNDEEGLLLPSNFEIGPNDVACGRGKGALKRPGNQKLQQHIKAKVEEYSMAKTKLDKSLILSAILDEMQAAKVRFTRYI